MEDSLNFERSHKDKLKERKVELYSYIKELMEEKNRMELELGTLKAEYQAIDRELAEMNITYCQPTGLGIKIKRSQEKPALTLDQVRDLADRLGVKVEGLND